LIDIYTSECNTIEEEIEVKIINEIETYYSDDFRKTFLEVHDEHIAWKLENEDISEEEFRSIMQSFISEMTKAV